MKKLLLSVLLTAFVYSGIYANDAITSLSEQQLKTMLCHKWKLTFLEYQGKRKEIPQNVPASYIGFLSDGTMYQIEGKMNYKGTWTYNHATKTITTIDKDGTELHTIVELNDQQFVMNGKYKGYIFNMGLKKAD